MAEMIKTFCVTGKGQTGWIEKECLKCGPLDAILRPIAMCPCTSDVHIVELFILGAGPTLGHEVVGEIVEVGELVKDFKPGDKVLVPAITPDWGTVEAQGGFASHCNQRNGGYKFTKQKQGAFAEKFHVNDADANLAHLPEGMGLKAAVMIGDMMSTGFYGAELADIKYGDTVAVIGIGPVGLMSVAASKIGGAGRIFAVGSRPNCVELAKEYGATDIISYKNGDIAEQIVAANGGKGVDRVIIAGGSMDTYGKAIRMCKPGGVVANVAVFAEGPEISIPTGPFGYGTADITIRGGLCPGGRLRLEKLANLVKYGRVDPSKLANYVYEGFEKISDAFWVMDKKPSDLIKPVVICHWDN